MSPIKSKQPQTLTETLNVVTNPQAFAAIPLSPDELIPDIALRALAIGDANRQRGIISEDDQSVLAMYLPDIIGELLAFRTAARAGVSAHEFSVFQTGLRAVIQRVAPGGVSPTVMVSPTGPKPSK